MVRTADSTIRVSGSKSSKAIGKAASSGGGGGSSSSKPSSSSSSDSRNSAGGGNPVHPRETPTWQKPITQFFYQKPKVTNGESSKTMETMETEEIPHSSNMNGTHSSDDKENTVPVKATIELESADSKRNSGVKRKEMEEDHDDVEMAAPKKTRSDFYQHLEDLEQDAN